MDFSPDGREAAVLTYDRAYLFQRAEGESWVEAFQQEPVHVDTPILRQAEAIAFDRDGRSLLVTTEKTPATLHRIPRLASQNNGTVRCLFPHSFGTVTDR